MKHVRALVVLAAALALPAAAGEPARKPAAPASPAWEKLKSLVGDWTGKSSTVTYRLVSSGTALMETIDMPQHVQMITMYHPDGDSILMTHYCAAGNQPRMRAKGLADGKLDFQYVDASNLASPDALRMSRLVMTFVDADHLENAWTSSGGGKDETATFALVRRK